MKLHIRPHSRAAAAAALVLAVAATLTACGTGGTGHHGTADAVAQPGPDAPVQTSDGQQHHVATGPYVTAEQVPPVISDVPSAPAAPTAPGSGSPSQPSLPPVRSMVRLLGRPDPQVLHHDICSGVDFAGPHATRDPGGRWVRFSDEDFTDAQLAVRSAVGIGGIDTAGYDIAAWMRGDTAAAMASPACKAGR